MKNGTHFRKADVLSTLVMMQSMKYSVRFYCLEFHHTGAKVQFWSKNYISIKTCQNINLYFRAKNEAFKKAKSLNFRAKSGTL